MQQGQKQQKQAHKEQSEAQAAADVRRNKDGTSSWVNDPLESDHQTSVPTLPITAVCT